MAEQPSVDVMKELGTLQPPDVKQEMSPDSEVPSELRVGEVTESSKTNETPLKPSLDNIMKHLKSLEERLGKDQGVIEKRLKSFEERLETVEGSPPKRKCNKGVQPDTSVNEKDEKGWTQLIHAARNKDIIKTTVLLKMGSDVSIADISGWLPLHYAAYNGFTEGCALLLLVGNADLNAKTKNDNETPLHLAATYGHMKVVELLLKFGADVNLKDSNGKTAHDLAVQNQYKEIVQLLDIVINRDMYASSFN